MYVGAGRVQLTSSYEIVEKSKLFIFQVKSYVNQQTKNEIKSK